jgi:hypothetical protein
MKSNRANYTGDKIEKPDIIDRDNRSVMFFVDNMNFNGSNFWINWITRELNLDTIIATNNRINDVFDSKFTIFSKNEGIKTAQNRICITTTDNNISEFIHVQSKAGLIFVDNLRYLYAAERAKKHSILYELNFARENGIKLIGRSNNIKEAIECDYYVNQYSETEWENFFIELDKHF